MRLHRRGFFGIAASAGAMLAFARSSAEALDRDNKTLDKCKQRFASRSRTNWSVNQPARLLAHTRGATSEITIGTQELWLPTLTGAERHRKVLADGRLSSLQPGRTYYVFAYDPDFAETVSDYRAALDVHELASDINFMFVGTIRTPDAT